MKLRSSIFLVILCVGSAFSAGLIDISYSPYTISQPGSYIVVADLTTRQNVHCITIATSNVTLDLNGHTLYGAGTTSGTSGCGIYASSGRMNITITNGIIRDFRDSGIYLYSSRNCSVSNVKAIRNRNYGIYAWNNARITDNTAEGNGTYGIYIYSGAGCVVTGNTAFENGNDGIYVGGSGVVSKNSAYENGRHGIYTGTGCSITGNSACSNSSDGISSGYGCVISENGTAYNGRFGISGSNGSTIIGNTTYGNDSSGIYTVNGCAIINNSSRANNYAGIQIFGTDNSISQNLCTNNTGYGLLSSSGNYFEQNKLRENGTNESLGGSTEGGGVLANVIF